MILQSTPGAVTLKLSPDITHLAGPREPAPFRVPPGGRGHATGGIMAIVPGDATPRALFDMALWLAGLASSRASAEERRSALVRLASSIEGAGGQ